MSSQTQSTEEKSGTSLFKRVLPLAAIALAVGLFFATGANKLLSFDQIALNYSALRDLVAANPVISILGLIGIYALATALSFPAAWLLTVAAGLVFGWVQGTLYVVIGATLGAATLYLICRYALADFFEKKAGPFLTRMAEGFKRDAVSYMLFLRLAPVLPFTVVNVVPAILGVPFITFVWTTFVGIIPGVIAYSFAGEGLRSIVDERAAACAANTAPCGEPLGAGDLVTTEMLVAFVLLAAVSLLPIVLKRLGFGNPGNQQ